LRSGSGCLIGGEIGDARRFAENKSYQEIRRYGEITDFAGPELTTQPSSIC
jgi:hypothetical protein